MDANYYTHFRNRKIPGTIFYWLHIVFLIAYLFAVGAIYEHVTV